MATVDEIKEKYFAGKGGVSNAELIKTTAKLNALAKTMG